MGSFLSVSERAKIASRYDVQYSVSQVQRWWRKNGKNAVFLFVNTELDIIVITGQFRNLAHPFLIKRKQTKPKHTVQCGFTPDRLLSPYIPHDTMNSNVLIFNSAADIFEWPIFSVQDNLNDTIFVPHNTLFVRDWLKEVYPAKWIG